MYHDGDTPICVAAHADLRICGGHAILKDLLDSCSVYKDDTWLLRQYNKPYIIVKSIYLKQQCTQVH